MNKTPTTLIIMDGFGLAPASDDNAVTLAKTPVLDRLFQEYAHTTLSASGLDVGLPAGRWATARWATPTSAEAVWCSRICPASAAPSTMAASSKRCL